MQTFQKVRAETSGFFPLKDMQTPPQRSGGNFMTDAECAEWNGKNNKKILRFLFFELSRKFFENLGDDVTKMTLK